LGARTTCDPASVPEGEGLCIPLPSGEGQRVREHMKERASVMIYGMLNNTTKSDLLCHDLNLYAKLGSGDISRITVAMKCNYCCDANKQ
jgi:hypothetical protein